MTIAGEPVDIEDVDRAESGIPVASDGAAAGSLVSGPGELQYGRVLFGGVSRAGWKNLAGWRGAPNVDVTDTQRPVAHGAYPGAVWAQSQTVTFDYIVRGHPDEKAAALDVIEDHTPVDGVERPLVVDDGTGPWVRMARVTAREVPEDAYFRHAPVECSIQWVCADPRRYALRRESHRTTPPVTAGGLDYPLAYELTYGEVASGTMRARNRGSASTPLLIVFRGPLKDPTLACDDWRLGFGLNLAAGESLQVDTHDGTALLNGDADRMYAVTHDSTPVEWCVLPPRRQVDLRLSAASGDGSVSVAYRHARM